MMVYRLSFAYFLFFFIHWLTVSDLTCCVASRSRAALQQGFFTIKTFLLVLLFGLTLTIPNAFFAYYAYVCLFASAFFLLMNVLFLVDFAYQWSDDWGERADDNPKWMYYLLIIAVSSFTIGIAVNILSFYLYVPERDCNYNAFSITVVLVAALLYTILSVWVPFGSVVPSAIVFLYTSSIICMTLRTSTDGRCNRLVQSQAASGAWLTTEAPSGTSSWMSYFTSGTGQLILGSLTAAFTLGYATVSSSGNSSALQIGRDDDGNEEDADRSGHLSHYMFFYFVMMLGSMYLAMLATNWHVSGKGTGTQTESIAIAFWVRQVSVWLAIVMYFWTLLAPYTCCKDRDYGFQADYDLDTDFF
ncbi:serine incorporator 3 [Strigomonas culicis]|uniref:Serine incorporator 3 n=2 Tax=Strigomonas culicis TaxID=28005 RepID=S9W467_9TRYP|nr:serine incorporator 3 [Strigomonas culicis]|eukprot:EPY30615.1 serine incorporator 3 [Strigomonas culicis]